MNTRRYPRTLNEAFGPYAHLGAIVDKNDRTFDIEDAWVMAVAAVTLIGMALYYVL